jgi:hypothetical protein
MSDISLRRSCKNIKKICFLINIAVLNDIQVEKNDFAVV